METFPTIQGGSPSSTSFTPDERQQSGTWEAGSGSFHTMATGEQSGDQPPGGRPRIVVESAAGHTIILTYEDLVLIALLATLGATAAGWFR